MLNDQNLPMIIPTIICIILGIIEYNLLFGFKIKYLLLEIIVAGLLFFPILCVFSITNGIANSIWNDDVGMQYIITNIPNYFVLYFIIKIIKDKKELR